MFLCVSRLGLGRVLKVQTRGVVFIWFVPVQPFAGYWFQRGRMRCIEGD